MNKIYLLLMSIFIGVSANAQMTQVSYIHDSTTNMGMVFPREGYVSASSGIGFVGNKVLFGGYTNSRGVELYISGGDSASTKLLKDIDLVPQQGMGSLRYQFTNVNGLAFFVGRNGDSGREIWRTDGTPNGTHMVKDIGTGANHSINSNGTTMVAMGNKVYFVASDNSNEHLFTSDGTEAGTTIVSTGTPYYMTKLTDDKLIFAREIFNNATSSLWTSDGTPAGTTPVKNIVIKNRFTVMNGSIYFSGSTNNNGNDPTLWKSDGTEAGTVKVSETVNPQSMIVHNNKLYIINNYRELYVTDGTIGNMDLISDSVDGEFAAVFNNKVYFTNEYPEAGDNALWSTDGTPAGTKQIRKVRKSFNVNMFNFTIYNDKLYFSAEDSTKGFELWQSDGTTLGTHIVKDMIPGNGDGDPKNLMVLNNELYFTANSNSTSVGAKGHQLFKIGNSISGITRVTKQKEMKAYPNPAKDVVYITTGSEFMTGILEVRDLSGRLVKSENVSNTNIHIVNVSDLMNGLYVFTVKGNNSVSVTKVMVSR